VRRQAAIILTVVLALILMVTAVGCPAPTGKVVTVGNKDFTEQYIIGQVIKQLLEDRGFTVELKSGRSTMYLREAMEFGWSISTTCISRVWTATRFTTR